MPIYHDHQLIHIHVPKTGGTAIEKFFHEIGDMHWGPESWLGEEIIDGRWYELQHLSMQELKALTASQYDSFCSFAVVRNPYTRLLSDYLWRRAIGPRNQNSPIRPFDSFDEFLRAIPRRINTDWEQLIQTADRREANFLIHVRPQYQYTYDLSGNCLVDSILRFERLRQDLAELLRRYGLRTTTVEQPPTRRIEDYYDRAQLDLVNTLYAKEFERFCYAME